MPAYKHKRKDREMMPRRPTGAVVTTGVMPGADMPRGEMTEAAGAIGEVLTGEMPSGQMTETKAGPMGEVSAGEMPRGEMRASKGGARGEVLGGEMPRSEMTEAEIEKGIGAIELPGLWRMTISPVSR
jgi:hypothetical protein